MRAVFLIAVVGALLAGCASAQGIYEVSMSTDNCSGPGHDFTRLRGINECFKTSFDPSAGHKESCPPKGGVCGQLGIFSSSTCDASMT